MTTIHAAALVVIIQSSFKWNQQRLDDVGLPSLKMAIR